MTTKRRKPARHSPGPLSESHLPGLASIVCDLRPGWDHSLVLGILSGHRANVDGATLIRAAVDAADDADVVDPRAIAWGLRRHEHEPVPTCAVCGKPADVCARRPGLDDDHEFVDKRTLSPVTPPGWTHYCHRQDRPTHDRDPLVRLPDSFTACRVCGVVRS